MAENVSGKLSREVIRPIGRCICDCRVGSFRNDAEREFTGQLVGRGCRSLLGIYFARRQGSGKQRVFGHGYRCIVMKILFIPSIMNGDWGHLRALLIVLVVLYACVFVMEVNGEFEIEPDDLNEQKIENRNGLRVFSNLSCVAGVVNGKFHIPCSISN